MWYDADANGIQDVTEPGLGGITVRVCTCTGWPVAETVTADDGSYSFLDLPPATYLVEFVLPSGYRFSPRHQGSNEAYDSDPDPATGRTECAALPSGQYDLNVDAGLYTELGFFKFRTHHFVVAGQTFQYYLYVRNNSPQTVADVRVTDHLPVGIAPHTVEPSAGGAFDGSDTVIWELGALAPGASSYLWISVRTHDWAAGTSLRNEAWLEAEQWAPMYAEDVAWVNRWPESTVTPVLYLPLLRRNQR